jgi:ElaB/YqjD/DUF883 family membrane-anchored ribosome-binding protein
VNAVAELYQAPLGQFVAERKRLAKESGDKTLLERRRPTISAWVVNQLWWHARDAFDRLMETADEIREGNVSADKAHREAIAKLRARAAAILKDAGHAATETVLRRVTTTLSAIAAAGDWQGHEPGQLPDDLDPPGFGAIGLHVPAAPKPPARSHPPPPPTSKQPATDRAAEHRKKQRAKLEAQLAKARDHVATLEAQLAKARDHAGKLESQLVGPRDHVDKLERALRDLDHD